MFLLALMKKHQSPFKIIWAADNNERSVYRWGSRWTIRRLLTKREISISLSSCTSLNMEQKTKIIERTLAKSFQSLSYSILFPTYPTLILCVECGLFLQLCPFVWMHLFQIFVPLTTHLMTLEMGIEVVNCIKKENANKNQQMWKPRKIYPYFSFCWIFTFLYNENNIWNKDYSDSDGI